MNLGNIPKELQSLNQWVCTKEGSKIPMIADARSAASSTDPDTWCNFESARHSVEIGNYDYVGFVFNGNGIIGVDIDDGYGEDGFISPLAADIIGKCKSYTERSRSGRGFHILLRGELPFKGKNNRKGVEIYKTARYFIMTGDILIYDEIIANQEAIDYIVDKHFPEMRENEAKRLTTKIYTPTWSKPLNGKIKLRPAYPPIPDGCRNICLTSLAGAMHNQGYSPQTIYDELTYCNTVACEPMLPDFEIVSIVNSVTRYKR